MSNAINVAFVVFDATMPDNPVDLWLKGCAVTRESGDSWIIEFEGKITVTETDGSKHTECARQTWRFNQDTGFLLTINFGTEAEPRVSLAGNDRTAASVIGETIAATIRATTNPPATHAGHEES